LKNEGNNIGSKSTGYFLNVSMMVIGTIFRLEYGIVIKMGKIFSKDESAEQT
jgi:hypothetical protein